MPKKNLEKKLIIDGKQTQILDISGDKYNRLTVIKLFKRGTTNPRRDCKWECICDCGKVKIVQANNLRSGHIRSCGCLQDETRAEHSITHGLSHTSTFFVWTSMKQRCNNINNPAFRYYGGRGIIVCERWLKSFENFLEDMGIKPEKMELDRIDNNKGYSKENCRWATKIENSRNKRNNVIIEYKNKKITIQELSEIEKTDYPALRRRIITWNMSIDDAIKSAKKRRINGYKKFKNNP